MKPTSFSAIVAAALTEGITAAQLLIA